MKLAVLSDVHGKDEKLRSIAGKLSAADKILFLGDLFTEGDDPNACWELLTQLHTDVWIWEIRMSGYVRIMMFPL